MTTQKRLTGGYFGTRRADFFPDSFMNKIRKGKGFADITAGTGQFPYRVATEEKMPVVLYERCHYIVNLLYSVFGQGYKIPEPLQVVEGGREGYLCELRKNGEYPDIFSEEVARYFDYMAHHYRVNKLVLYALGKLLVGKFTFRGRNFTKYQANGHYTKYLTVDKLHESLIRSMTEVLEFRSRIEVPCLVREGDSTQLLKEELPDTLKDFSVYADPAWPWAKGFGSGTINPYKIFSEDVSSILLQKTVKTPGNLWERAETPDLIMGDVKSWIDTAFQKGASQFILCTQDTNYPTPEFVEDWVRKNYKLDETITINDWSSSANRQYINYWFFIKP